MADSSDELPPVAFGMDALCKVDAARFSPEDNTMHFDLVCEATRLDCPACGMPDQPIHDRLPRAWRHLHFLQYLALLHAKAPRVRCTRCGRRKLLHRSGGGRTVRAT